MSKYQKMLITIAILIVSIFSGLCWKFWGDDFYFLPVVIVGGTASVSILCFIAYMWHLSKEELPIEKI